MVVAFYFRLHLAYFFRPAVAISARPEHKTENEFRMAVAKYIEFYNDYRPHQRLGFLTPNQLEMEFYRTASG